jgi:hypothetical protein
MIDRLANGIRHEAQGLCEGSVRSRADMPERCRSGMSGGWWQFGRVSALLERRCLTMKRVEIVFCAAILFAPSQFAKAETLSEWADAGEWKILVDADVGDGCLMEKTFEDGSRIRIGHLPERKGGFLSVVNKSWTDMTEDESFTVRIDLDDVAFGGDVEKVADGEWRGGYAFFNNPAFAEQFARKNNITITGPKNQPVSFSLKGSSNALKVLAECHSKHHG